MPTKHINDSDQVAQARGTFTALKDSDILDYPGKKDGQIVGEVIQEDEVKRLATVNGIWSQIYYKKRMEKEALDIFQPVFWRIQQQRRIRKSQRSLK